MDNQEYLNQISTTSRPINAKKNKTGKWYTSKFFIIGVVFVVALIVLAIIGALIRGGTEGNKSRVYALNAHISYDMDVINQYQGLVKSSILRSDSASLYNVLSNTSRDLAIYTESAYGEDDPSRVLSESKTNDLELARDGLLAELFDAKINGTLDIIYARKLVLEISLLMSEEQQIYNNTSNEDLINMLQLSYNSLKNLYDKINGFSES